MLKLFLNISRTNNFCKRNPSIASHILVPHPLFTPFIKCRQTPNQRSITIQQINRVNCSKER